MSYKIIQGDNRDTLKTIPDNSIDAIVTDPPYGIDFLGKSWDANTGALETYQECLRVLKPGGHILAFSAARTYHHLAVTLEQAGFEIRDQIMWIYSSGFPKSQDIGKQIQKKLGVKEKKKLTSNGPANGMSRMTFNQSDPAKYEETKDTETVVCTDPEALQWAGWGTALKPAHEPIALARKPMKGNIRDNCQKYGTGALNIDATRVPYDGPTDKPVPHGGKARQHKDTPGWMADNTGYGIIENPEINPIGRYPSNVLGDIPDYQKYFYCPKVSRRERHIGFDPNSQGVIIDSEVFGKTPVCLDCGKTRNGSTKHDGCDPDNIGFQERRTKRSTEVGNNHPTVKPIELMKYLIKLITPPGGTVLDPFNGSGSTGCAAVELGHPYIGCELDPAYVEIANKRIAAWLKKDQVEPVATTFEALFQ
jgi:site-specific DNA-methyltransferase (adenine-specific)